MKAGRFFGIPGGKALVAGLVATVGLGAVLTAATHSQTPAAERRDWWNPGDRRSFFGFTPYPNDTGMVGILSTDGEFDTTGHPFFEPIGSNGRACVTCHQPADGMSLSLESIRQQWTETNGADPLFAPIDGANCPTARAGVESDHSLLLERGLFRIAMPWPPRARDGSVIEPEFSLEVVDDPPGCNTDPVHGVESDNPTVSVYRRPRQVANLKYVVGPDTGIGGPQLFNPKGLAMPMAVDPDTGQRVTMQIMSDARHHTLKQQAQGAAETHLEKSEPLSNEQLAAILSFEEQVYSAQAFSERIGSLMDGPQALGPQNVAASPEGVLGDNFDFPVFFDFDAWKMPLPDATVEVTAFRQSVARGYDVFFLRPFWIRDSMFINSIGLGNPIKRTCATCHNMQTSGMDVASGWVDVGTANLPWAPRTIQTIWSDEKPDLPLFKVTCREDVPPHEYLGREIYTTDPGRALVTGRCMDVGAIVMQQFRGLSARAPYFSNGSAANLRELVDFYDRRYDIGYTDREKTDLVNFLSVL